MFYENMQFLFNDNNMRLVSLRQHRLLRCHENLQQIGIMLFLADEGFTKKQNLF